MNAAGEIVNVRVVPGWLGRQHVYIQRQLLGLRFDGHGPVALDKPCGVSGWVKASTKDLPEVNVWLHGLYSLHFSTMPPPKRP